MKKKDVITMENVGSQFKISGYDNLGTVAITGSEFNRAGTWELFLIPAGTDSPARIGSKFNPCKKVEYDNTSFLE
ncbi:MAG: hypothetical protein Q8R47_04345 [Nanoarchaeota archaeon]|nr:hypothetical protein [Nanoarchaeota archaeon]